MSNVLGTFKIVVLLNVHLVVDCFADTCVDSATLFVDGEGWGTLPFIAVYSHTEPQQSSVDLPRFYGDSLDLDNRTL